MPLAAKPRLQIGPTPNCGRRRVQSSLLGLPSRHSRSGTCSANPPWRGLRSEAARSYGFGLPSCKFVSICLNFFIKITQAAASSGCGFLLVALNYNLAFASCIRAFRFYLVKTAFSSYRLFIKLRLKRAARAAAFGRRRLATAPLRRLRPPILQAKKVDYPKIIIIFVADILRAHQLFFFVQNLEHFDTKRD